MKRTITSGTFHASCLAETQSYVFDFNNGILAGKIFQLVIQLSGLIRAELS